MNQRSKELTFAQMLNFLALMLSLLVCGLGVVARDLTSVGLGALMALLSLLAFGLSER